MPAHIIGNVCSSPMFTTIVELSKINNYYMLIYRKNRKHSCNTFANNANNSCNGNITYTEKHGGHVVIGSIFPSFDRPVGGRKMFILRCSPCSVNAYGSNTPHEKCVLFRKVTIILLTALTICDVFAFAHKQLIYSYILTYCSTDIVNIGSGDLMVHIIVSFLVVGISYFNI